MDIHKPKAMHSVREFLVEIGTIILGILIALSLEGVIEGHRNRELADRARQSLRDELRHNREVASSIMASATKSEGQLGVLIAYGQGRLNGELKSPPDQIDLSGHFGMLSTAAWESTLGTQALVHIPYPQAQALTDAYAESRNFNNLEDRIQAHWFELAAFDPDPRGLTRQEVAKAVAELRVALSYQRTVVFTGKAVLKKYDVALSSIK